MDEDEDSPDKEPPVELTREHFLEWRSPRRGTIQAEDQSNPVWEWLVRSRMDGWSANKHFIGPDSYDAGPVWCCDRFGQSTTILPDGRTLLIGGEHEDSYDPDFHIYNDVIVRNPHDHIQILGYPEQIFPPTDFHSATIVGESIILIGNLGYPTDRRPGETQVLRLDTETLHVTSPQTIAEGPGWIHKHHADLATDGRSILITGGQVWSDGDRPSLLENIDNWRLWLDDFRWERLTRRTWPRFELRRCDKGRNRLFEMGCALWDLQSGRAGTSSLPWEPPSDPELFRNLYVPELPHETVPENEDEHRVTRISIEGITVRYQERAWDVIMTVEGELPESIVERLRDELLSKLEKIEGTPYEAIRR